MSSQNAACIVSNSKNGPHRKALASVLSYFLLVLLSSLSVLATAQASNPIANAGGPYHGSVGATIVFDGSSSVATTADRELKYLWNFGDQTTSSSVMPIHAFRSAGNFQVTLTVTDSDNASSISSISVLVIAQVLMPNLKGLTQVSAAATLKKAGLKIGKAVLQTCPEPLPHVLAGRIANQWPKAGSSIPKNSLVFLLISNSVTTHPLEPVPQLVGSSAVDGIATLVHFNLLVGSLINQTSEPLTNLIITRQDPSPLASIHGCRGVNLVLGLPTKPIPTLTGLTFDSGVSLLRGLGLRVDQITYNFSATLAAGTITGSPIAGTPVSSLTPIDLFVAAGPNLTLANPAGPYNGVMGGQIQFDGAQSSGTKSGSPLAYKWDFGDGFTVTGSSPAHTYASPGIFMVTLTVTDILGASNTASTRAVIVPPDPSILASSVDGSVATTLGNSTAFLYSGASALQTGVAPNTIVPTHAAILRGRVTDSTNTPLLGVTITILSHPEFGQTLSRTDGLFDMEVNGGGPLTVNYFKLGLLSAQRQVQVRWQDYTRVPDVILIPLDTQVTTIDLTSSAPVQVARGSIMADSNGTRQATILFPQGTRATMVTGSGSTPISSFHFRATEYTVGPNGPLTMPAGLPPASAYTYAVELSIDESLASGTSGVVFNQPLPVYVENFLSFPVGTVVPLGGYDRTTGVWRASDNGVVLKILNIANGVADLDTIGTGSADQGTALGITIAERQSLATLYSPGQTLWRMPIPHLSAWDSNWGFGPPPDSGPPPPPPPPPPPGGPHDPKCKKGSVIECESQVLGETMFVTGTRFSLNYRSDRVRGRSTAYTLNIPLSGASLPGSLKSIELEVSIAGQFLTASFPPTPNQIYTFTWDGKDVYGRSIQGIQLATIRIGYTYAGIYESSSQFGHYGNGIPITGNRTRRDVTLWQLQSAFLGTFDFRAVGLGAWSLNVHHVYDPVGNVLYLGDGTRRSGVSWGGYGTITSVAGTGQCGFSGDGGLATQAQINPHSVAIGFDGSLYIADYSAGSRVRRVDPGGIITTVAGTGQNGFGGDGGPATQALLDAPSAVAVGSDGSYYIVDMGNNRVRRVDPSGIINTVAGNGQSGLTGDGGPAIQASLMSPLALAIGPDGSLYVASHFTVRRVDVSGIITTVAGSGRCLVLGDGAQATTADLISFGVAVKSDGSLFTQDFCNAGRVRYVDSSGIISTVAGNGQPGFGGDGGPATQGSIDPFGIAVGPDDSLFIADEGNQRVRRIDPSGIISTVAGNGQRGFGGDGGPAAKAMLQNPAGVTLGPDGSLYIVEQCRVRLAAPLFGISQGNVLIAAADGNEIYEFDPSGKHLRTLNSLTGATVFRFNYHPNGYLTQVIDGDNNITSVNHDGNGNPNSIAGPFNLITTLGVDANGYLNSITDPGGAPLNMTYDTSGLLLTIADRNNNTSKMQYDPLGRLRLDTDAAGGVGTLVRTDSNRSYTVNFTTGLNRATVYQIQNLPTGNELRVQTFPDGAQTQLLIGTDGSRQTALPDGTSINLVQGPDPRFSMESPIAKSLTISSGTVMATASTTRSVTLVDPTNPLTLSTLTDKTTINNLTSTRTFDSATNTITNTTPAGRTSTAVIDAQGRITQAQVSGLNPVNLIYLPNGQLKSITQQGSVSNPSRSISLVYDNNGRLQTITDPLNRNFTLVPDPNGGISQINLPDGHQVGYTYDFNGNLKTLTSPGQSTHSFSYTTVNLPLKYTPPQPPSTGNTISTFNADQQITQVTRPDLKTVSYGYDPGGRLSTTTIGRGSYTFSYFPNHTGQVYRVTAPDGGTITYEYGGALLTRTTWNGTVSGTVARLYDNNFRLMYLTVGTLPSINFQYDPDGLIKQIGAAGGMFLLPDPQKNGLLNQTGIGNESETFQYNGFGEVTSFSASVNGVTKLGESYPIRDQIGRIKQRVEQIEDPATQTTTTTTFDYVYDSADRLYTVSQNGTLTATYIYDDNGNRKTVTRGSVTISGSCDSQDHLNQYGSTTYTYTMNGELQNRTDSSGTATFNYDELGNLLSVTQPNGTFIEYVIDGQNRRIGKKIGGALIKGFLYQDRLKLIAELDGSNNVVSEFVYGSHVNVPDYMIKNGTTYRIVTDQLGSARLVVDVLTGQIAQRIDYDEFGRVINDTSPGFQPFGFAGGFYDNDTKLVRFGARDYDADTGRWTAKDPLGIGARDFNFYSYVGMDPINYVDPSGLCPPFGHNRKECKDRFLRNYFGDFSADWLVPNFSAASYMPGSDYFQDAWESVGEVGVLKLGGLKGIIAGGNALKYSANGDAMLGGYSSLAGYRQQMGAFLRYFGGEAVADFGVALTEYAGGLGVALTVNSSLMDFLGDLECGSEDW